MFKEKIKESRTCDICGITFLGNYCPNCGQRYFEK